MQSALCFASLDLGKAAGTLLAAIPEPVNWPVHQVRQILLPGACPEHSLYRNGGSTTWNVIYHYMPRIMRDASGRSNCINGEFSQEWESVFTELTAAKVPNFHIICARRTTTTPSHCSYCYASTTSVIVSPHRQDRSPAGKSATKRSPRLPKWPTSSFAFRLSWFALW